MRILFSFFLYKADAWWVLVSLVWGIIRVFLDGRIVGLGEWGSIG